MSATAIEWTETTWNPVTGCDRISPGCDHCYALRLAGRLKAMGQAKYQRDGDPRTSGPGFGVTCHPAALDEPLRWRKPRLVFVNSMADLFHEDVPDRFIADVFDVMACHGPIARHTFQVLTKRPKRMATVLRRWASEEGYRGAPNVWLGTSIENDRYAFRAGYLRSTPAAVRFLSLEPLLGPLPSLFLGGVDWVIVGGESGPGAWPMHPDWARDIRDRCVAMGIPFFFKQWGAWVTEDQSPLDITLPGEGFNLLREGRRLGPCFYRVGKKAAGRLLDGRTWDEMPRG